ncbi:Ig-like domain-containing protein [Aphelenchoides besseyi]|nr:Ig-like domain-containing protein [Aphelenchoides besseyi]
MNALLVLSVVIFFCIYVDVAVAQFAQGSLQLVFHPRSAKSSDTHPQTSTLTHLWCQAAKSKLDGTTETVPIKTARFYHFGTDHKDKQLPARIDENNRAHLDFGQTNLTVAGKYRCELTTEDDKYVYGNMFVYMRPVFHTNGTMRFDISDSERNFEITGSSTKAVRGKTAMLSCPAKGYPVIPEYHWEKDGQAIQTTEKYQMVRNELYIRDVDDSDEGIYRCIAFNEFPPHVDYREVRYEATLDQQLRVTSSLSWLIPLVVIILILILLAVVIYSCAFLKRRKESHRYNVASAENKLKNAEEQRLRSADDDEE